MGDPNENKGLIVKGDGITMYKQEARRKKLKAGTSSW